MIFLAEAFTRPKVMHRLAKLGFTQSYTYFTWRNTKQELTEYFTELSAGPGPRVSSGPICWPNTPDILPEYLQVGGRPAFMARLVLAATLSANYGIYGPAFELHGARAARAGQRGVSRFGEVRAAPLGSRARRTACADFIARVNRIRRDNPALQQRLEPALSPDRQRSAASATPSRRADLDDTVVVVVNLDPHTRSRAGSTLDLDALGLAPPTTFPGARPADRRALPVARRAQLRRSSIPRARRRTSSACAAASHSEHDFDYFA